VLKDPSVQEGIASSLQAVKRLIHQKYQDKTRVSLGSDSSSKKKSTATAAAPAKQPSFFDMVYNYFTDATEDESEKNKGEEANELRLWSEIS
jgi:hypothetical protein